MSPEEPAKTVLVVSAAKTEAVNEREMLASGVRVLWAPNIVTAIDLLIASPETTVVIAELALKDGNWRDLVEAISRIGKSVHIALVSPVSTSELWWDALECGVEEILPAPLSNFLICHHLKVV